MSIDETRTEASERRWRPLTSVQRRVVGVLIEKAKTTPDAYPMTLNALVNGCNQKSNRAPQMNLTVEDIERALEELREMGAAAEVQAGGRVPKYRHYMYEWLGVDKVELAVMAELLLRGEQTLGDLRTRSSRMEPVADLHELRPIIDALMQKELVVPLTPAGRGQVVTHNLYSPERLAELRREFASGVHAATTPGGAPSAAPVRADEPGVSLQEFEELVSEVAALRADVDQLRDEIDRLKGGL